MTGDENDFDISDISTQKEITMPTNYVVDGVTVTVSSTNITTEIQYEAGAAIDADGAPNAYALPSSGLHGLDNILNALDDPGHVVYDSHGDPIGPWAGVIVGPNGKPIIQTSGPWAGFCLSPTALSDHNFPETDYRRFVDATRIAYISVPPQLRQMGVCLGDGALVADRDTGLSIQALVADIGPRKHLGEVSVACAQGLRFPNYSPRNGGVGKGIIVRIFLGSAANPPWDYRRTQADVAALVDAFASQTA